MGGGVKNGGQSWLFGCCFLVFVVLAECQQDPARLLDCNYIVIVETSCPMESATAHPVYIRFGDKDGNEVMVRPLNYKLTRRIIPFALDTNNNNTSIQPFQPCTVDEYRVTDVCIGTQICYIYLKLMEEKDNWRVGSVQVRLTDESKIKLSSSQYEIRKFIPPKAWHGVDECDRKIPSSRSMFGMITKRRVFFHGKKIRRF